MSEGLSTLGVGAMPWIEALGRASVQGGIALLLVGGICRLLPRLPHQIQCWLWRLAYLKLLVALLWAAPIELPLLPADPAADLTEPTSRFSPDARDRDRAGAASESPPRSPAVPMPGPLLLLWLAGAVWQGARGLAQWRAVHRLRASGRPVREGALHADYQACCRHFGLRREPALLAVEGSDSPLLIGVTAPAILLPASFAERFSRAQLRLMLAHELAHVRRRDLLWSWLPHQGRVLFFFHPLLWLAEEEWRLTQEAACDEEALAATGVSHAEYGTMLLGVMAPAAPRAPFLTVGVADSYASLRRRLVKLRQSRARVPKSWAPAVALLAAVGVVGVLPWRLTPRPAPLADRDRAGLATRPERGGAVGERAVQRPRPAQIEPRGDPPTAGVRRPRVLSLRRSPRRPSASGARSTRSRTERVATLPRTSLPTAARRPPAGEPAERRPPTPKPGAVAERPSAAALTRAPLPTETGGEAKSSETLNRAALSGADATYDELVAKKRAIEEAMKRERSNWRDRASDTATLDAPAARPPELHLPKPILYLTARREESPLDRFLPITRGSKMRAMDWREFRKWMADGSTGTAIDPAVLKKLRAAAHAGVGYLPIKPDSPATLKEAIYLKQLDEKKRRANGESFGDGGKIGGRPGNF